MRWLLVVVAACYNGPSQATEVETKPVVAPAPPRDQAFPIAGRWTYRVRTNECNAGTGVGAVEFAVRQGNVYSEVGHVLWPDGMKIAWNGETRYSPSTHTYVAVQANSLDDAVESQWSVDREHDWLVVRWKQSNGCSGVGIAAHPNAPEPDFSALALCAACSADRGCSRVVEDGDTRGHTYGRYLSCLPLCCR